jgi:DnaJ-class molecular chaperone
MFPSFQIGVDLAYLLHVIVSARGAENAMNIKVYKEVILEVQPSHLLVRCGRCQGTGTRDRDGRDPKCSVCGGAGRLLVRVRPGSFIRCGFCRGDGTRDRDGKDPNCPVCLGVGGLFRELPAVVCQKCNGTGSRDRDGREPICKVCRGSGVMPLADLKEY